MDLETFPMAQLPTSPTSSSHSPLEPPLPEDPTPQQVLTEERTELQDEWISICKKEYSLFETLRQKEEIARAQKLKLRNMIKDRYEAELLEHAEISTVQISIDSESHFYIRQ
jgi:hypothetical protein